MQPKKVVLIGAGAHAREVMDILDARNRLEYTYDILGYVVDSRYGKPGTIVNDRPILGDFEWFKKNEEIIGTICALGPPEFKCYLARRARALGVGFFNAIHPEAVLTKRVTLGKGVVIAAGCVLTSGIKLGNHVHLNLGCTVSHDVIMEDFVYLSPGVNVAGGVVFEEGCCVGIGAKIIQGKHVGAWSVVGAGAVIIEDVPPNSVTVGVPGRVVKTRPGGWHLNLGSEDE